MSWHDALASGALEPDTPTAVRVDGRDLCLVRLGDAVHAFDDACPHRRWPLHLGTLEGPVLRCRAHTWEWDVRDGRLQRMRAPECLTMHEVRERDGRVEVFVDPTAPPAAELSELWRESVAETAGVDA
jgi:3-phenylpropionate/trans-cinnamate dioxygenase ferredoxin subunit